MGVMLASQARLFFIFALHVKNYQKSNVKKMAKIEICYALPLAHFHGTAFGYPKPGLREHCTCNTTK